MILRDYEKTRSELNNESMRNEELFRELEFYRCQNKDLDNRIIELTRDNEHTRQNY
ncbi:MAG: hypothetical protein ACK521_09795 [bacterium]|jgi:hypothetical protein